MLPASWLSHQSPCQLSNQLPTQPLSPPRSQSSNQPPIEPSHQATPLSSLRHSQTANCRDNSCHNHPTSQPAHFTNTTTHLYHDGIGHRHNRLCIPQVNSCQNPPLSSAADHLAIYLASLVLSHLPNYLDTQLHSPPASHLANQRCRASTSHLNSYSTNSPGDPVQDHICNRPPPPLGNNLASPQTNSQHSSPLH